LRLGVSAWRLSTQPLGVNRYTEYLLQYWPSMLAPSDDVTVFVCQPWTPNRAGRFERFTFERVQPRLTNGLWENLLLPRHAKHLDVLFGPSYTLPLTYKGRTVVAIHSADEAGKRFPAWRSFMYEQKYRLAARKADKVIVNAESVKEGVMECYGISSDKIEVIGLAADDAFRPIHDQQLLRATRQKYVAGDRPYILFVGGLSTRRNVPVLLTAFSRLKKELGIPHALLLVGPNRGNVPLERLAHELHISDSVFHTVGRFADHQELVLVYNAADVFILPSTSEGFSLTLIEAMRCGIPVITVNRAALGEVAKGYGLTIEEPTVEAVTDALRRVLTSSELRQTLRANCLKRASEFSWEKTARKTLAVLRDVAGA
jgi:glycosyltransferase involved in cell wall biosynthesis